MRAAILEVLGRDKYDFFFEKFLEYFFTREDAKFLKGLGLNCLRIPVNCRHFVDFKGSFGEDLFGHSGGDGLGSAKGGDGDGEGQEWWKVKEEGFRLVDRIVEACAAEGIYTIIDMHTFPGGQNQGWHCDSGIHKALFWEFGVLQEGMIRVWAEIARRYRGNTWVRVFFSFFFPVFFF